MKKKLNITIFLVILPLIMSAITHFGYITGYTQGLLSSKSFQSMYNFGIYKYRVLSKVLLLETDKILSSSKLNGMDNMLTRIVMFIDPAGKLSFYFSYFIINSFFFILSTIFFYLILRKFAYFNSDKKLFGTTLLYIIAVPIFQYVLVPYDYTTFFFNNLIIFLFLYNIDRKSAGITVLMLLSIILSTLNRETSALSLAFMGAFLYSESKRILPLLKFMFLPALAFIIPYIGLRLYYGFDSGLLNEIFLYQNLASPLNQFGIFTGIVSVYLFYYFANYESTKKAFTYFLVFSLPYILVSLISGVAYEIRLWTPLLINLAIILVVKDNQQSNHTNNMGNLKSSI